MSKVSKSAFRKAACSGALDGCEVFHTGHGTVWVKDGKPVAARHDILFIHTFYLGA